MIPHPVRNIVVFDIDGTIADDTHRATRFAPWRLRGTREASAAWEAYYSACVDDRPITAMRDVAHGFSAFGYALILATGRPERLRELTLDWLDRHRFPKVEGLLMRSAGLRIGNAEIKREHAEVIGPERIALWVDDHPDVPEALRDLGIPVLSLHNRTWEEGEDPMRAGR